MKVAKRRMRALCFGVVGAAALALAAAGLAADERAPVLMVTEPWPPLAAPGLDGQGVLVELATEVFKRQGYAARMEYYPWARALSMVRDGTADCLVGAYYSDDRANFLAYPQPTMSHDVVLYGLAGKSYKTQSLDDLRRYAIGVVRFAVNGRDFDRLPNLVQLVDLEQCVKMLLSGRVDLIAGPDVVTRYLIDTKFAASKALLAPVGAPIETQDVYCAISKKSPRSAELLRAFNLGLAALRGDGGYRAILAKHGY